MSYSKLESLPNEILIELFEQYINGVDLINAFASQLNHRFDHLIFQCQRFRFDFLRCRKDHFRLCMDILPAYIDRIEDLTLSDDHAPDQVTVFLALFPSFTPFKKLRRLYFCASVQRSDKKSIHVAILSLCHTRIDSLDIGITGEANLNLQKLHLSKLNKLSVMCQINQVPSHLFPNLQQLTLRNNQYTLDEFGLILRKAPKLKYLNVLLNVMNDQRTIKSQAIEMNGLSLQTLIIGISQLLKHEFDQIEQFLRAMPNLRSLEVRTENTFADAIVWQQLFTQSLPALSHFILHVMILSSQRDRITELLAPFQTHFWMEKNNFRIIISEFRQNYLHTYLSKSQPLTQSLLDQPVERCWIAPVLRDQKPQNPFRTVYISHRCRSFVPYQQFDDLASLILDSIGDDIYRILREHIKTSQIRNLTIIPVHDARIRIASLLSLFPNLRALGISFPLLFSDSNDDFPVNHNLQHLDLSAHSHPFHEEELVQIKKLFPNLEHLFIRPQSLDRVLQLQVLLPGLHSLKLYIDRKKKHSTFEYGSALIYQLAHLGYRPNFSLGRDQDQFIIWLNQDAFQEENQRMSSGDPAPSHKPQRLLRLNDGNGDDY